MLFALLKSVGPATAASAVATIEGKVKIPSAS
jgi:hypothetical protein